MQRALDANLDLAAAGARLRAARAMQAAAGAAFRPRLSFGTVSSVSPDSRTGWFQAGFDASWELGLFGRGEAGDALATAETTAAEADRQAVAVSLTAEVVRQWLEARAAAREARLHADEQALLRERARLTQAQIDARLAGADALVPLRAALERAQAESLEPAARAQQARARLAVLLGRRDAELPDPEADPAADPAPHAASDPKADAAAGPARSPPANAAAGTALHAAPSATGSPGWTPWRIDSAPADLLRHRADIRQAEAQVGRAAAAAGLARAELAPRLALGGTLGLAWPITGDRAGDAARSLVAFGPTIDIPLFDWSRRQQVLQARRHELDAAVAGYRQAVLAAGLEVETAIAQLGLQRQRRLALARAEQALAAGEDAAATRLSLRLGDALELNAARDARLQARRALAQSQSAEQLAFVALFKALGGAPLPEASSTARQSPPAFAAPQAGRPNTATPPRTAADTAGAAGTVGTVHTVRPAGAAGAAGAAGVAGAADATGAAGDGNATDAADTAGAGASAASPGALR